VVIALSIMRLITLSVIITQYIILRIILYTILLIAPVITNRNEWGQ
jgi:hypothetical protein